MGRVPRASSQGLGAVSCPSGCRGARWGIWNERGTSGSRRPSEWGRRGVRERIVPARPMGPSAERSRRKANERPPNPVWTRPPSRACPAAADVGRRGLCAQNMTREPAPPVHLTPCGRAYRERGHTPCEGRDAPAASLLSADRNFTHPLLLLSAKSAIKGGLRSRFPCRSRHSAIHLSLWSQRPHQAFTGTG
jgi:hypothetical protein